MEQNSITPLKLYIAVLDEVPDHMVPVLVAHAVLGAHLEFGQDYHSNQGLYILNKCAYKNWLKDSFRKVVLKVNRKEFEKIKQIPYTFLAHENTTLGGEKSCAVVCPRTEYPNVIKFAEMWQPTYVPSIVDVVTNPNGF